MVSEVVWWWWYRGGKEKSGADFREKMVSIVAVAVVRDILIKVWN